MYYAAKIFVIRIIVIIGIAVVIAVLRYFIPVPADAEVLAVFAVYRNYFGFKRYLLRGSIKCGYCTAQAHFVGGGAGKNNAVGNSIGAYFAVGANKRCQCSFKFFSFGVVQFNNTGRIVKFFHACGRANQYNIAGKAVT